MLYILKANASVRVGVHFSAHTCIQFRFIIRRTSSEQTVLPLQLTLTSSSYSVDVLTCIWHRFLHIP